MSPAWQPNNLQWWIFAAAALLIAFAWPPNEGKSLAAKTVNWAVDPRDGLPILPDVLGLGEGDNPQLVYEHDLIVQQYDALYLKGGWTRKRLELKVAGDPFDASTTRQVLTVFGVATALLAWRFGAPRK